MFEASSNRTGSSEPTSSRLTAIRRGNEASARDSPNLTTAGSNFNVFGAGIDKAKSVPYDLSHFQTNNPFPAKASTIPLSLSGSSHQYRSYGTSSTSYDDSTSSSSSSSSKLHYFDLPPGFPNVGNTCYMCVSPNTVPFICHRSLCSYRLYEMSSFFQLFRFQEFRVAMPASHHKLCRTHARARLEQNHKRTE